MTKTGRSSKIMATKIQELSPSEKKRSVRAVVLMVSFFLCVLLPIPVISIAKQLTYEPKDCIREGFHNGAQLNDTEYALQVTRECWAFGMHLSDYLEYSSNGHSLYLRKYGHHYNRNSNGSFDVAFDETIEARLHELSDYPHGTVIGLVIAFTMSFLMGTFIALIDDNRLFIAEMVQIGFFVGGVFLFFQRKLLTSGEYSIQFGLHYANLFSIFPPSFKVDATSADFVLSPTFAKQNMKQYGNLTPSLINDATTAYYVTSFFVIAICFLCHLFQLIVWILSGNAFAKKTKLNAGNELKKGKLDAGNSATNAPSEVVVA